MTPGSGKTRSSLTASSGMTLLELLVAMAIFLIIAGAGYTGLRQGIDYEQHLSAKRQFWRHIESVHHLLQTDLAQAVPLSPATRGSAAPWFSGGNRPDEPGAGLLLQLSREAHHPFTPGPVSPYQRVTYRLSDGGLYRTIRGLYDMQDQGGTELMPLLENIKGIQLRYLTMGNTWTSRWPRPGSNDDPQSLPQAVELNINVTGYGNYRWLFHVGAPR